MTKVMCTCIMCRYNSSKTFKEVGECRKEKMMVEDFEYQSETGDWEDLAQCTSFSNEGVTNGDITYPPRGDK